MLSSKQLIEITGISRATLNNYVALGILPAPVIKTPGENEGRATRLGYFDESAAQRIRQVQQLKRQGMSMAQIARALNELPAQQQKSGDDHDMAHYGAKPIRRPHSTPLNSASTPPITPAPAQSIATRPSPALPRQLSMDSSIETQSAPAYMVNNSFELIWWNEQAKSLLHEISQSLTTQKESINLLELLLSYVAADDNVHARELLLAHLSAGKQRLTQQAMIRLYSALNSEQLSLLKELHEQTPTTDLQAQLHSTVMLRDETGAQHPQDLHVCFYREGILFSYCPMPLEDDYLLNFLARRDPLVAKLAEKRGPFRTDVAVLVADLQDARQLECELPAEEYFELINTVWQESATLLSNHHGTFGKHVGEGLLYFFLPAPDCDFRLNALRCSVQLQQLMSDISRRWKTRKGWFRDIHLNIGLDSGQEWFGAYHARGRAEFSALGETSKHAQLLSDAAREGSVWATKPLLDELSAEARQHIDYGITHKTQSNEAVFVRETYTEIGKLAAEREDADASFRGANLLAVTEIRSVD